MEEEDPVVAEEFVLVNFRRRTAAGEGKAKTAVKAKGKAKGKGKARGKGKKKAGNGAPGQGNEEEAEEEEEEEEEDEEEDEEEEDDHGEGHAGDGAVDTAIEGEGAAADKEADGEDGAQLLRVGDASTYAIANLESNTPLIRVHNGTEAARLFRGRVAKVSGTVALFSRGAGPEFEGVARKRLVFYEVEAQERKRKR